MKKTVRPHLQQMRILLSLCIGSLAVQGVVAETRSRAPVQAIVIQRHDWLAPDLAELSRHDPLKQLSLLRQLEIQHPKDPRLPRLLGTLLARQQRWSEARQAFEQAHRDTPADPDTSYNLAICLDHLGQRHKAIQNYQQARRLAEQAPFRFQSDRLRQRLIDLQDTP